MFMMDECVGHMSEKVVIPPAEQIEIYPRRLTRRAPGEYQPYEPGEDLVPEMAHAGEGHRFHVTGLTHDERGYPSMTVPAHDRLVRRLQQKVLRAADDLVWCEEEGLEGAEVAVVSYGITSRVAQRAIELARQRGVRVGKLRLIGVWPFPDRVIRALAGRVKAFVVPELNLGQMVREVERAAAVQARVVSVTHAGGGVHRPEAILEAILEAAQ
jgi:2-oxoglutarate ferredoxin oxidoreductase subunit alpha